MIIMMMQQQQQSDGLSSVAEPRFNRPTDKRDADHDYLDGYKSSYRLSARFFCFVILMAYLAAYNQQQQQQQPNGEMSKMSTVNPTADSNRGEPADRLSKPRRQPPEALLDYRQFLSLHEVESSLMQQQQLPPSKQLKLVEDSRRQLWFIADLINIAGHNHRFFCKKESYLIGQSFFSSLKTRQEQLSELGRALAEATTNLDWLAIDKPVGGFLSGGGGGGGSNKSPSPQLKTGSPAQSRLARLVKGRAHFEIPNFELDEQPDPEHITHIDSDLRSCLGEIRAQAGCGACYAFSWLSLVEWHYCKQAAGRLIDLSEQHIIDCSEFGGFNRCSGGKLEDVGNFVQTFGFHLEETHPYRGNYKRKSLDECTSERHKLRIAEWRRIPVERTEWELILNEQPILVQAHLPRDIMSYQRGVHPGNNCDTRLLHGMLLVGHGRHDGQPYWLLRNSMGKRWGENGYLRLSREASSMSSCFATGFVGKFRFAELPADSYDEFYSSLEHQPAEHIL